MATTPLRELVYIAERPKGGTTTFSVHASHADGVFVLVANQIPAGVAPQAGDVLLAPDGTQHPVQALKQDADGRWLLTVSLPGGGAQP